MPKVKVGDINIYYEIHGEGEPVVIIPGATGNVDWLFPIIPVYSQEYQLILYDPRGAGRTDAPDIPYTMEIMAEDLAGLLDAIGIESAHFIGPSMGGMISQEFALRYPERVRSLILACTGIGVSHGVRPIDQDAQSTMQHLQELSPKELIMEILRATLNQEFVEGNPDFINELAEKMLEHPVTPHGMRRQMEAGAGFDTYERLPEIKAPTLVIHGEADRSIPVENGRILASRIPGAELAILEGMGHLFMYEAFDESNRIMLDFLRRHSATKA